MSNYWRDGYSVICRTVVGATFLCSAASKLTGFGAVRGYSYEGLALFAAVLREHGLIAARLTMVSAAFLVLFELVVGAWLLASRSDRRPLYASMLALLFFTVYMCVVYVRFGSHPCGCMGDALPTPIDSVLIRNSLLLAACFFGMPRRTAKSTEDSGFAGHSSHVGNQQPS